MQSGWRFIRKSSASFYTNRPISRLEGIALWGTISQAWFVDSVTGRKTYCKLTKLIF